MDCFVASLLAMTTLGHEVGTRNHAATMLALIASNCGIAGIAVTVHLIGRASLRAEILPDGPASSISRSRIAPRPVIERPFTRFAGLIWPARSGRFVEPDHADATCPVLFAKIFPFPSEANHFHVVRIPAHTTGAFRDRHERRAGMRWTRVVLLTRALSCGR
jgi:hypothetical protein